MRLAMGIEYCGSQYNGWQAQLNGISVQEQLEKAITQVANHRVKTVCAGRTDTGVHALQQVIHFDAWAQRSMRSWQLGTNANLPKDIAVLWVCEVPPNFHARFSAKRRRYQYIILNRSVRPTYLAHRVSWDYRTLDEDRMQRAASVLIGEHDFSSFRAAGCQSKTPMREIFYINVSRRDELLVIDIEANAFLHHMVRNIVGVLTAIGSGEKPVEWCKEVLELKDRTLAGVTAPACGLYLVKVEYDATLALPTLPTSNTIWCGAQQ